LLRSCASLLLLGDGLKLAARTTKRTIPRTSHIPRGTVMLRAKASIKDVTANRVPPAPSRLHAHSGLSGNHGSIGNQAMLRRLSHVAPRLQCKLTIGAVNDPLETEADRVADQVMRMPDPGAAVSSGMPQISRKCAACDEEDKKVHAKPNGTEALPSEAPPVVNNVLNSSGQPLDTATRAFFEPRFGADFSGVRVHSDAAAADSAGAINARAYTVGRQIVLGADAKHGANPLLAHELAHVVQQGGATSTSSRAIGPLRRAPEAGVILRSESVHPEEQYCEDLSRNPGASCAAIIECIEDLIEQLAGRFADVQEKGGDEGHWQRIVIVQGILKALMAMALLACKNGEYDQELQDEAQKWGNKTKTTSAPEKQPDKSPDTDDQKQTLREKLPSVPTWVWAVLGAAVVALIVACIASGACEIAAILAAAGEAVGWILINAMRLAGVGLLAQNDASAESGGNQAASAAA
jgi:hypothetical protein